MDGNSGAPKEAPELGRDFAAREMPIAALRLSLFQPRGLPGHSRPGEAQSSQWRLIGWASLSGMRPIQGRIKTREGGFQTKLVSGDAGIRKF